MYLRKRRHLLWLYYVRMRSELVVIRKIAFTLDLVVIIDEPLMPRQLSRYIIIAIIILTAVGLTPGGNSTVHIYIQTVHRIQKRNIHNNKNKNLGSAGRAPCLELYPGICITTVEKARKTLIYGSRKVSRYPGGSSD
jgi:hypothetical protein